MLEDLNLKVSKTRGFLHEKMKEFEQSTCSQHRNFLLNQFKYFTEQNIFVIFVIVNSYPDLYMSCMKYYLKVNLNIECLYNPKHYHGLCSKCSLYTDTSNLKTISKLQCSNCDADLIPCPVHLGNSLYISSFKPWKSK